MRRYRGMLALAEREALRTCKAWPTQLLGSIIIWALYLVVIGVALGRRIGPMDGTPYAAFLASGMVVMGIVTDAPRASGNPLWQARHDRYINDVLAAPMRPGEILLGYMLGPSLRPVIVGTGLLGIARLLVGTPIRRPVVLLVAALLTTILFLALGVVLAITCRTQEQLQFGIAYLIQPLAYISGVYFSITILPTPYRHLIRLNPIFYPTQAIRAGLLGTADTPVWLSLTITTALAVALVTTALWLFTTGRGLKA